MERSDLRTSTTLRVGARRRFLLSGMLLAGALPAALGLLLVGVGVFFLAQGLMSGLFYPLIGSVVIAGVGAFPVAATAVSALTWIRSRPELA